MISVDKILLLQQKVDSAVQKIERLKMENEKLKSENDALRRQCTELTTALSEKTDLLSSFSADERKIESGILQALSRLESVENSVLDQKARERGDDAMPKPQHKAVEPEQRKPQPTEPARPPVAPATAAAPTPPAPPTPPAAAKPAEPQAAPSPVAPPPPKRDDSETEKISLFGDTDFSTEEPIDVSLPDDIF